MHTNIWNYVFYVFVEKICAMALWKSPSFVTHNLCDLFDEDHFELADLATINMCDNLCIFDFSENVCYLFNLTYFFLQLDFFKLHVLPSL
jgi:hypothetical protein